jgi:hypothetical protein
MTTQVLQKLKNDDHYYGEFGKRYLSNSDIGTLLSNPQAYKAPSQTTPEMVKGSYLHTLLLDPDRVGEYRIIDASSRNTNKYKEESEGKVFLLREEAEEVVQMVKKLNDNFELYDLMHIDTVAYEEPAIGEIFGAPWKGKADILKKDMIIDIKTTSRIDDFKFSARKYNYDSQAYVYEKLFGVPVTFVAIEKGTHRTAVFDCSHQFLLGGEKKVIQAVNIWARFFGPEANEDINNFVNHLIL